MNYEQTSYEVKVAEMLRFYISIVIYICVLIVGFAQPKASLGKPIITNFELSDYNAHSQNWAIAQDSLGRMYFGNSNGLLTFDGSKWQTFTIPNNTIVRSLLLKDRRIYVGAQHEFGYFEPDNRGKLNYVSLKKLLPDSLQQFTDVWSIISDSTGIFFSTANAIFIYRNNQITVLEVSEKSSFLSYFNGKPSIILANKGLLTIENDKFKLIEKEGFESTDRHYYYLDLGSNTGIKGSRKAGISFYGKTTPNLNNELHSFLQKNLIYTALLLPNNQIAIGTLNGGLVIVDSDLNPVKLIDKSTGLIDNAVYSMYLDREGNLWVATENGISCIELNSPISFFSEPEGINGLPFSIGIADKNLYFSITTGVYTINIEGNNVFQSKKAVAVHSELNDRFWDIETFNDTKFFVSEKKILIIEKNLKTEVNCNFYTWQIDSIKGLKNNYWLFSADGMRILNKHNHKWTISNALEGFVGNCRYAAIDSTGNLWIAQSALGITKLTPTENYTKLEAKLFNNFDSIKNIELVKIACTNSEILASVNNNLYRFNKAQNDFVPINLIPSTTNFYLSKADQYNAIFMQNNSQPGHLTLKNDSAIINKIPYVRLPETKIILRFTSDSNFIYIGYPKQIFIIDKHFTPNYTKPFNTLITGVSAIGTDSVLLATYFSFAADSKIAFNSDQIALRFNFSASYYQSYKNNLYSFKLDGFDNNWSKWSNTNYKEYTNLPPGTYTFLVRSKNIYGFVGNSAAFSFSIKPPFYETPLAFALYALLIIIGIKIIISYNTKRLINKNKLLEEIVRNRTMEIITQKEQIKVHAGELEFKNKELKKLSIIAEKTANAISIFNSEGELEWINAGFTKLFGYELHEIRTLEKNGMLFCTNILQNDQLQIILQTKNSYNAEASCRHKNGSSIWVQTTLTPILNHSNAVEKIISVATDITALKVAEEMILQTNEEIEQQRDELLDKNEQIVSHNEGMRSSLRYAKTIQQAILPEYSHISKYLNTFIIYFPKDIVSGDFYWFNSIEVAPQSELKLKLESADFSYKLQSKKIEILIVSDCTGHGVPGAFMSIIGNRLLNEIINDKKIYTPSEILSELHFLVRNVLKQASSENTDGMDIAVCTMEQLPTETKIIFAGSKRPLYIYSNANEKIKKLRGSQLSIGGNYYSTDTKFTDHLITCKPNDAIYLTTDGFIDQNSETRKRFGSVNLEKLILSVASMSTAEQKAMLEAAFEDYKKNTEQRDDVTIIGVQF